MRRLLPILLIAHLLAGAGPTGTQNGLDDPVVVPPTDMAPMRLPGAATAAVQPGSRVVIGAAPPGQPQGYVAGYPVSIAWDHVAVGAAILGVMFLLGTSTSTSGSF